MKRFLNSFLYAFKGLGYAFSTQLNFKIHCFALALVIFLGLYFQLDIQGWLWLAFAAGQVIIIELLNTAIEVAVDLIAPNFNEKAGRVKDLAAAAVLVSAMVAVIIAALIFIPKVMSLCCIK